MTEYDYSPAAYERYLAQQTRVSNWVHDTVKQSHSYADPFVLSPNLRDRSFYDQPDDHPSSLASSRPSRTRSRSYVDHYYDRANPSRHRSQSHSRSASTPRDLYAPRGHVYPQTHAVGRTPAPHVSPPHNYQHQPSRQPYVTQPPPGQIYHIPPNPPVHKDMHRYPSTRHTSNSYLLVQGGGPKAEYKRGVRPVSPAPTPADVE